MKKWALRTALILVGLLVPLTLINASWLAPEPQGEAMLIAHRGLAQLYHRRDLGRDTCTADRIYEPYHSYQENTIAGVNRAFALGSAMVEIDIAPTRDGELAVFHDWTLDCRTQGAGPIRAATLAELKALDIGYGYTADGGQTFPFRGQFEGAMPSFEEMVEAAPEGARLMVSFKSGDPKEADLLSAKLKALGRDPAASGDGFYGHTGPIDRMRELHPGAWSWNPNQARACSQDYALMGWSGYLPESCRGGTLLVPLNYQWAFWGWPNRLIARMEEYGGRVLILGPVGDNRPRGLTLPEQLEQIPDNYNGYIWIEDAFTIAPALYPERDDRTAQEVEAANKALDNRRLRE